MNKLLLLFFVLTLTACGGGSGNSNESTSLTDNSTSTPMLAEGQTVYSFGEFSEYINTYYSYSVNNGIVYKTLLRIKENTPSTNSGNRDEYIITSKGVYINLPPDIYTNVPWKYFVSDNGYKTTFSFYNNANELGVVNNFISYDTFNVSGKKVSDYIYSIFLTNNVNPSSAATLHASAKTFPEGAFVFKPTLYTLTSEHYELRAADMYVSWDGFDSIDDIDLHPLTTIFGNITIRHNTDKSSSYALYNGRVYQAIYRKKNYEYIYNPGRNYFYNQIAAETVASELAASF